MSSSGDSDAPGAQEKVVEEARQAVEKGEEPDAAVTAAAEASSASDKEKLVAEKMEEEMEKKKEFMEEPRWCGWCHRKCEMQVG